MLPLSSSHRLPAQNTHSKAKVRQAKPFTPAPRASHKSTLRGLLSDAGARHVKVSPPSRPLPLSPTFDFPSIEVLALCLNAVRGKDILNPQFWKCNKRQLARALLASPRKSNELLLEIAECTAYGSVTVDGRRVPKKVDAAEETEELYAKKQALVGMLYQQAVVWVALVHSKPYWPQLRKALHLILEADPQPLPIVIRDGFTWEGEAISRLQPHVPAGWQLLAGLPLDFSQSNDGHSTIKGVKGEVDAALLDAQDVCQGVLEMKLGGKNPYKKVYNDIKKLNRLMDKIRGKETPVLDSNITSLKVSQDVQACYLLCKEPGSDDISGQTMLQEAEKSILMINLSMGLGSHTPWTKGIALTAGSHFCSLELPRPLIDSMRQKVAKDFVSVLTSVDIYEMDTATTIETQVRSNDLL